MMNLALDVRATLLDLDGTCWHDEGGPHEVFGVCWVAWTVLQGHRRVLEAVVHTYTLPRVLVDATGGDLGWSHWDGNLFSLPRRCRWGGLRIVFVEPGYDPEAGDLWHAWVAAAPERQ